MSVIMIWAYTKEAGDMANLMIRKYYIKLIFPQSAMYLKPLEVRVILSMTIYVLILLYAHLKS